MPAESDADIEVPVMSSPPSSMDDDMLEQPPSFCQRNSLVIRIVISVIVVIVVAVATVLALYFTGVANSSGGNSTSVTLATPTPTIPPTVVPTSSPTPTMAPSPISLTLNVSGRTIYNATTTYSGEAALHTLGMWYGSYISQLIIRKACTSSGSTTSQLFIGYAQNVNTALSTLGFQYSSWNEYGSATPQYTGFLSWVRTMLGQKFPLISAVYTSDGNNAEYDYMIPVVGYTPSSITYYNCITTTPITKSDSSWVTTRSACVLTATEGGCLPRTRESGVAIKGVVDDKGETYRVKVTSNRSDEPTVPVSLTLTVTVEGLSPTVQYWLIRYDDHTKIPRSNFLNTDGYSRKEQFTATDSSWTRPTTDTVQSNAEVFYRCVKS